jgi:hypothetical protein
MKIKKIVPIMLVLTLTFCCITTISVESSSAYDPDAYQNVKKANKELNYKGKIFNMDCANIKLGDVLQLRVTSSDVSENFPMFKYMVVRGIDEDYYYCEDLLLKPVDTKGNEISIEQGKNEGEVVPYKIKYKQSENLKRISKDFVSNTHYQYALSLGYTANTYRPLYAGDLIDTVPVGIEELNNRIKLAHLKPTIDTTKAIFEDIEAYNQYTQ